MSSRALDRNTISNPRVAEAARMTDDPRSHLACEKSVASAGRLCSEDWLMICSTASSAKSVIRSRKQQNYAYILKYQIGPGGEYGDSTIQDADGECKSKRAERYVWSGIPQLLVPGLFVRVLEAQTRSQDCES